MLLLVRHFIKADIFLLAIFSFPYYAKISISPENVFCIYLILNIVKTRIVTVGYNDVAVVFEFYKIAFYRVAGKFLCITKGGFIYQDSYSLIIKSFHNALNRALPEVVAVAFHCKTENACYYVTWLCSDNRVAIERPTYPRPATAIFKLIISINKIYDIIWVISLLFHLLFYRIKSRINWL